MKNQTMFASYPDVVDVDSLRKMLGGIGKKLAYRLLADQEIKSVRIGRSYRLCYLQSNREDCHNQQSSRFFYYQSSISSVETINPNP